MGPIGGGLVAVVVYYGALVQGLHKFDDPIEAEDSSVVKEKNSQEMSQNPPQEESSFAKNAVVPS